MQNLIQNIPINVYLSFLILEINIDAIQGMYQCQDINSVPSVFFVLNAFPFKARNTNISTLLIFYNYINSNLEWRFWFYFNYSFEQIQIQNHLLREKQSVCNILTPCDSF